MPSGRPANTAASPSEVAAPSPTTDTTEIISAENSSRFAALLQVTDTCDASIAAFADDSEGRTVRFDGSIGVMAPHDGAKTRYDILVGAGDFSETLAPGPAFQFNDVNTTYDMHYTGETPGNIGVGTSPSPPRSGTMTPTSASSTCSRWTPCSGRCRTRCFSRYGRTVTDDDDVASTVAPAELRAMLERAPLEAAGRDLRLLPAMVMKNTDVLFAAPGVTLDDALDIAVHVGAAFVTLGQRMFDLAEFLGDAEGVPAGIRNSAASHDGDLEGMDLRFIGAGVSYAWWAAVDWSQELTAELEEWQEDADEKRDRERRERLARAQQLIQAAIDDAGVRAAKPMSRKPVVEAFIRSRIASKNDVGAEYALRWAPQRVAEEWRSAYALLDNSAKVFIADLHELAEWQRSKWNSAARRDVLLQYAMSRTGGWAPTDKWLKDMDAKSAPST